ncbi:fumarylacetoacetase [Paraglaciecola sp.]|uniref:fumarylacetoacetase n=1 Tax=Paraglaciecola sp. TaxID=1920173 RepID=UPI00273EA344|nr:fumarylacetoacetase [Paraglaciecola sp.]MDP5029190.1 fumarylacetoacetase [Paraglaciecola sp.]
MQLNETHDPALQSWLGSANEEGTDFPIQNLPFAVFRRHGSQEAFRVGTAIGDQVIDLSVLATKGLFLGKTEQALKTCLSPQLNELMALGYEYWSSLRLDLSRALRVGSSLRGEIESTLVSMTDVEYALPAQIGDYTDFYSSIYHATNVGKQFRPDNPLLPNYQWVPIGYHGRSSSIAVSGQQFHRPCGQTRPPTASEPQFGPAQKIDYELELGIFVGRGNALGDRIAIDDADQHVFGLCLFNDWSARDIQAWEYQPLGPFLSKNFASTVSPWVITFEALAPFTTPWTRAEDHPQPMPYLESDKNRQRGGLDIVLEVAISTAKMRKNNEEAECLATTNFKHSYWSVAQMLAHHTINGCNMRPGDLLGSGTQSGPHASEAGSLLELSQGGKQAVTLKNGETRSFLEDGDTVIMRGHCAKQGAKRIGFGEVTGTLLPAKIP